MADMIRSARACAARRRLDRITVDTPLAARVKPHKTADSKTGRASRESLSQDPGTLAPNTHTGHGRWRPTRRQDGQETPSITTTRQNQP